MDTTWIMSSPVQTRPSRQGSETSRRRRFDRQPRSRAGCITCRARHKRCDERTPTCQNCESLNIRCEGYNAQLRWQEKYMRMANIPDTSYRSLRYVNISPERFSEEMERLMEEFSPFDVDHDNDLVRNKDKVVITNLDVAAYLYRPTVFASHVGLDSHNASQYNLLQSDELYSDRVHPKLPLPTTISDMFPVMAHGSMTEVDDSNYLCMAQSYAPLTSEYVYAPATVLPGSSELISLLEPPPFY
ncbi:hypothetical protein V1517DRAFT_201532 [Lipomyces orientalis]|uniref:Uncharacterized protein n=1 Tax=Lipomyces orientalis TaxID=1233043 RepID=A0ACC3TKH7_9ASCO